MKILIIPDSFKGSATNVEVAQCIAEGVKAVDHHADCQLRPLADGGEGSLETIRLSLGGDFIAVDTEDPLGRPMTAYYLRVDRIAYVELARASGLQLLSMRELDAGKTSTRGTGLLIRAALRDSVDEVVLCIGGSATNDGGCGIAEALGYRFINQHGENFLPVGNTLGSIRQIVTPEKLPAVRIRVLCDVNNPLTGPRGATYTYGPQKGAYGSTLHRLEEGMIHFRNMISGWKGIDLDEISGAGAAGGVGGGMMAFFDATLESGIQYLMQQLEIEKEIAGCDLIFTGEGKIDHQTGQGKLISGITGLAAKYHKPVVALCGVLALSLVETRAIGLTGAFSILKQITSEEESMQNTCEKIRETASQITNLVNTLKLLKYG